MGELKLCKFRLTIGKQLKIFFNV